MKLSQWAKQNGIPYRTAWRWFHNGDLKGRQMPSGTIIIEEPAAVNNTSPVGKDATEKVAVYARVSSAENKNNLNSQADRVAAYCAAKGWKIHQVIKEVGSGVNDHRPKLMRLLADQDVGLIVVEHKDRLTRFGFNYIETLLQMQGRRIEAINEAADDRDDIVQDFVAIITSFCARLYGQRRAKRKTEKIIAHLHEDAE